MIAFAASSLRTVASWPDPKSKKSDDDGEKIPNPPKDVPPVGITNNSSEESRNL